MTNDCPILIGLGCSTAAGADEIVGLIQACLIEAQIRPERIVALASHSRKRGSRALGETASHFGVPLLFLDDAALSPGVAGTSEAVAAAAGPLRLTKRKSRYATCAIAECVPEFTLESFAQSSSASAAMAASTLTTSVAGP